MSDGLPAPWQRRPRTSGGVRRIAREEDVARFLPGGTSEQCAALVDGTFYVEYVTDADGSHPRIELPVMDNFGEVWLWVLTEPAAGSAA